MAEKRMFSKTIVQSTKFLKMPAPTRELYFQIGMGADDDGVCEAWNVLKITSASEKELRELVTKGFLLLLDEEDMIVFVVDWHRNNTIRADRYHKGAFSELLETKLSASDNQVTTTCQPSDNQVTTTCQQNGNRGLGLGLGLDNNAHFDAQKNDPEEVFLTVWKIYPLKKGKGRVSKKQKQKLAQIGIEELTRCIERYVRYLKESHKEEYMMHGSTFFNSGYVDYLDENQEPEAVPEVVSEEPEGFSFWDDEAEIPFSEEGGYDE